MAATSRERKSGGHETGDENATATLGHHRRLGTLACALPSGVWRLLMIAGWLPGTGPLRALHEGEGGYVLGLSVAQLLAAVLVVGLVRPWGERFAGVDISTWVPVVLGVLGGTIMTALFTVLPVLGVLQGQRPDQGALSGGALALFAAAYLPMFFFGPLTLAATAGYAMRRSQETYAAPALAPRQPTRM